MRILLVLHSITAQGGAERVATNLATAWTQRGWQVAIATFVRPDAESDFHVPESVRLFGLDLSETGIGLTRSVTKNLRRLMALRSIVRTFDPDVLVGMQPPANTLVALAGIVHRARTIGSERTYPPVLELGWLRTASRRFGYGLLNLVVAQTSEATSWLEAHTCAQRTFVIPNHVRWPLPPGPPVVNVENAIPAGCELVLAVGRLSPEKQFEKAIEAFGRIAGSRPSLHLAVLGAGPERDRIASVVACKDLSHRVTLPGRIGNLADWYGRASMLLLTSKFEGFPNALLEAMSYGVPAISYDCLAGPRDVIRNGMDGFLVPPDDVDAMAQKLARLADDAALRQRLSAAATEVRTRFSSERILDAWDQAITLAGCAITPLPRQITGGSR